MTKDIFEQRATKAIALVRVSSEDQKLGYSLDGQRFRSQEYCLRHGLELVKVFEIVESSTTGDRKEFHAAINFAKSQKERFAILTDKVDRLQRRLTETPLLEDLISKGRIELHFHVENVQIHKNSTSQERLMWNLHVILAQSYVDALRDNVNRSIQQKLRKGEWVSTAPLGYLHIKGSERGTGRIITDVERAPLIRKLFETYATGEYTLADITRKAKTWGLNNRQKQGFISKPQIHVILQTPFYYGVMKLKKTGKEYPHIYEPLITKELFDACEAVRLGWNKKPFKYGGKEYVFRGMITCATTGRVVSADTKKRKRTDGAPYEITYLGTWNPNDTKKKVWVREDDILKQVKAVFSRLRLTPEVIAEVMQYIRSGAGYERDFYKTQLEALYREQNSIKAKLDKLMDFWLEGKITEEEHIEKRESMIARRNKIVFEISQQNSADDKFSERMQDLVKISGNAYEHFKLSNVEGKRRLVNLVFSTMKLRGKNLEYSLRCPFDQFIEIDKVNKWRTLIDDFRQNTDHRTTIMQFPFYIPSQLVE